jgi:hypothetical protein
MSQPLLPPRIQDDSWLKNTALLPTRERAVALQIEQGFSKKEKYVPFAP